jgi:hypothetical protein
LIKDGASWLGWAAVPLAAVVLLGMRVWLAATQPLWLDETWTAAIVSAPGARFWREVYLDVNAPLYYLLMRGWTAVFGLGDLALRLPGLILAPMAAVLVLVAGRRILPAQTRSGWAALLFFWWGCGQFLDVRCYGLLLLLCTLQTLAFIRLLRAPTTGKALAWCAICALAILCQYYALFIGLTQGLIYLGRHRGRALKTWPALIALVPAAAWIAYHAPRLADYGRPDVAWHQTVDLANILVFASFTFAGYSAPLTLAMLGVLGLAALWPRRAAAPTPERMRSLRETGEETPTLWPAAAAGVIALALVLISGVIKPTLTARYLIPLVPSILLGVALCARATGRGPAVLVALVIAQAAAVLNPAALAAKLGQGAPYGAEPASDYLMRHGVTDVVFLWDHPAAKIMDPLSLTRVGSVFFRRAGARVVVSPLVVGQTQDANRVLLSASVGRRPGLIWIYDRAGRTSANTHPPRISQIDPRWTCATFGDGLIGSVACYDAWPSDD